MDLSFWNIVINTRTWIKMNWSVPVPGLSPNAHNTCCRSYNVIIITTIKQHMLLTLCLLISLLLGPVETIITSGSNKVCVCISICAQRLLRFKFFIKQAFTSSDMGSAVAGPSAADPASTASCRSPWRFWGYLLFCLSSSAMMSTDEERNDKYQQDKDD